MPTKKQEWLHPYSDTFNSGFSPQEEITKRNAADLKVLWTSEISSSIPDTAKKGGPSKVGVQTTPLIIDGTVYVGDGYNIVYAFDAQDGAKKWSFDSKAEVDLHQTMIHTLNFRDGLLYFMAADATLYGLNPNDGKVV